MNITKVLNASNETSNNIFLIPKSNTWKIDTVSSPLYLIQLNGTPKINAITKLTKIFLFLVTILPLYDFSSLYLNNSLILTTSISFQIYLFIELTCRFSSIRKKALLLFEVKHPLVEEENSSCKSSSSFTILFYFIGTGDSINWLPSESRAIK